MIRGPKLNVYIMKENLFMFFETGCYPSILLVSKRVLLLNELNSFALLKKKQYFIQKIFNYI